MKFANQATIELLANYVGDYCEKFAVIGVSKVKAYLAEDTYLTVKLDSYPYDDNTQAKVSLSINGKSISVANHPIIDPSDAKFKKKIRSLVEAFLDE